MLWLYFKPKEEAEILTTTFGLTKNDYTAVEFMNH